MSRNAFTNFATTTLASNVTAISSTLTLATGTGALFPAAGSGVVFDCVIVNTHAVREVVRCTARSGDTLTVTRAQEGTTAVAWVTGDIVSHRVSAALLDNLARLNSLFSGAAQSIALQAQIDAATATYPVVRLASNTSLDAPLLLRTTTQQNIALEGTGRVSTNLVPAAADIKVPAQNINALIINQQVNAHLHLSKFRWTDSVVYTGKFLYCKYGGGADGLGQALFSSVFDDMWFAPSSNNTGCVQGGLSNHTTAKTVWEGIKDACYILEGAGNSDHIHIGSVQNNCYDNFIKATDVGFPVVNLTVMGHHAYQHNRGPIFNLLGAKIVQLFGIVLEPAAGSTGTGVFKFDGCYTINCVGHQSTTINSSPRNAVGIDLVNVNVGKLSMGQFNSTVGLRMSGTGTVELTFTDEDFTGCDTAAFQILSGTLAGKIKFVSCKFSDAQKFGITHTAGVHTMDADFFECEFLNAGLDGTTTARNISVDVAVGKTWNFYNCKIGQNNGSASATHFIAAGGAGTIRLIHPEIIGAPPTALTTGAGIIEIIYRPGYGSAVTPAATITPATSGNVFPLSAGATAIDNITATNNKGRTIKYQAAGVATLKDGTGNLKMAGDFVTAAGGFITFTCDGTDWWEDARSVN